MDDLPEIDPLVPSLQKHRQEKLRQFREYLVDKEVVLALAKFLLALRKSDHPPENPAQYLQDYFGNYRDPAWDEVDRLQNEVVSLRAQAPELERQISQLKIDIETAKRKVIVEQTYDALDPDGSGVVSTKQLVQKLSGFGRFDVDLKLSKADFVSFVIDFLLSPMEDDLFDPWELFQVIAELTIPSGDAKPKPPPFQGRLDDPKYVRIIEKIRTYSTA